MQRKIYMPIYDINLTKMGSKHAKKGLIYYYVHALGLNKKETTPYGTYLKWVKKNANFCTALDKIKKETAPYGTYLKWEKKANFCTALDKIKKGKRPHTAHT